MNNPLKIGLGLAIVIVVIIGIVALFTSDSKTAQTDVRNRVPNMTQSAADAQKAALDAQAAATRAEAALKEIQEASKPKPAPEVTVVYTNDGTPQEHTGIGHVTDVTEIWEPQNDSTQYGEAYIAFTFMEDGGFQKRFYPVCSDQVIQSGKSSIAYHWAPNKNTLHHNEKGCFRIDSYMNQKGQ